LFAGFSLLVCFFIYLFLNWDKGTFSEILALFVVAMLPSLAAVCFTSVLIFYFFSRKGYFLSTSNESNGASHKEHAIEKAEAPVILHDTYRDIPWPDDIAKSGKIFIIVNYFESWVKLHWKELSNFFKNGGSFTIFLPNPNNDLLIESLCKLFPDKDEISIKRKILNTALKLEDAKNSQGSSNNGSQLNIFFYDKFSTYHLIKCDNRKAVFSSYEQFREGRTENPAFSIRLDNNETVNNFFMKEINGYIEKSELMKADIIRKQLEEINN
jgi:hypothetical protein